MSWTRDQEGESRARLECPHGVAAVTERDARTGQDLHVAVVLADADVCFVAAARSPHALTRRLAAYVRERAPLNLWPEDARLVGELLDRGELEDASEHYFRTVGNRWDHERLVVTAVPDEVE